MMVCLGSRSDFFSLIEKPNHSRRSAVQVVWREQRYLRWAAMRKSFRNDETRTLWSLKNLLIGLMSLENAHGAVVRPNGSLRNIKTFPFRTKQKYFWIGRLSLTDRKASVTSREEAHIPRKRCGRMEDIDSIFNGRVEI